MTRPQLWVFAGPNGAGKSTIVARFHVAERIPVVNPDAIARRLKPDHKSEPALMLKAGRIAAAERRAYIRGRQSFAIETTLTGQSERRIMEEARAAGYKVTLVFLGLDDALIALARVRERVAQGGHDVPAPTVLARYAKSLANLPAALALTDRAFILDNTGPRHRLLLALEDGQARSVSRQLPTWARNALPPALRQTLPS